MTGELEDMLPYSSGVMSGTDLMAEYPSLAGFRKQIVHKVCLELPATSSTILFPQSSIEETMENVRHLTRGFPQRTDL